MKIIDMPRGTGKTYQLAQLSEKTGYPVLVATNYEMKDCSRRFPNATFISVDKLKESGRRMPEHMYIDELFWVLNQLLPDTVIEGASFSSEQEAYAQYRKFQKSNEILYL